jgi:hypothetical protein
MAKQLKEQTQRQKFSKDDNPIIPAKYQHLAAIAVIYISLLIFFHAMIFEGKKYQSNDSLPVWQTFMADAETEGYAALWNPYIFCGYPGYAGLTYPVPESFDITTILWEDLIGDFGVRDLISLLFFKEGSSGANLLFYLIYGIGMYFLSYRFLKNKPIAVIVALMAVYATYVSLLIMMGHITKLVVLSWFPFVFLIVDKLKEKFNLILALLLPILVRLLIQAGHMQFILYFYIAMGTYLLFFLIRALLKKENWKPVLASGTTLILATGIAFLMGATQHLSTLEYNPYSMRGSNPIQSSTTDTQTKTISGGLDYDYATSWSFSPGEIMTFFVPSWYGFGPMPYQGPLTQNQMVKLNLYWGPQPFVDGPQYMGIITIVLAMIGFYRYRKEPVVQYMAGIIVFSLLVSFGKEFSLIYDLMYRYFPMFNKFRIPLMILILVQIFTPILAGYGILSFVSKRNIALDPSQLKKWKYIFIGGVIAFVAVLVGKGIIKDLYSSFFSLKEAGDTLARSYGKLNTEVLKIMYDLVFSSIWTDILIGIALLISALGLLYNYQRGKIRSNLLYIGLAVIVLFDLWRIAYKPHDPVTYQEANNVLAKPGFVDLLKQDSAVYRVLRLSNGQPVYDNSLANWHLYSAYGYHGAKMRIFQDMVDVAGMGNPLTWQLMNIKYLISNTDASSPILKEIYNDGEARVYEFIYNYPHAFFVNKYEVADGITTLNNIASRSFDPRQTAFMLEKPKVSIDVPGESARAAIVKYGTQDLELRVNATGNNLLFLSDAYYPKGWNAYIDGNPADILRLNYLFRGVIVPQGEHVITMKFEPRMFYLGKQISLWISLIIYGMLILWGVLYWREKKKALSEQDHK